MNGQPIPDFRGAPCFVVEGQPLTRSCKPPKAQLCDLCEVKGHIGQFDGQPFDLVGKICAECREELLEEDRIITIRDAAQAERGWDHRPTNTESTNA